VGDNEFGMQGELKSFELVENLAYSNEYQVGKTGFRRGTEQLKGRVRGGGKRGDGGRLCTTAPAAGSANQVKKKKYQEEKKKKRKLKRKRIAR